MRPARYVGQDGKDVPDRVLERIVHGDWAHPLMLRSVLAAHHITYVISYQPAGRYWLFQAAAAAVLALLAAGLGAAAVWLATRRP